MDDERPTGREATIEAAVRVAARQLSAVGPSRMTVRSVAEEAGVNHALVHRHLGTKKHLVASALDYLAQASNEEVRRGIERGLTALQLGELPSVRSYVAALARCLTEDATSLMGQTNFPVLRQVATAGIQGGLAADTAKARAVAYMSTVFGVQLFAAYFADAIGLNDVARRLVREQLDRALRQLDRDLGLA